MKPGDLVKVVLNDMSLVIPVSGVKNSKFFDQVGVIVSKARWIGSSSMWTGDWCEWWVVQFPAGLYEVSFKAIEVISENR